MTHFFEHSLETFSAGIPGDSLSTAIIIPPLPFTIADSTNKPCLNNTLSSLNSGNDIIYQFTTNECHASLNIDFTHTDSLEYHIFDDAGNSIHTNIDSTSTISDLINNSNYYIAIQAVSTSENGSFSLELTETLAAGLITGDTISDPILIDSKNYTSDIVNQAGCFTSTTGNVTNDVFFQFTTGSSCMDSVIISTCEGTDFNTLLRLLDENGTQIDINYNGCGIQSQIIRTDLEPNTIYYAVVEGSSGQSGTFTLTYRETLEIDNISNGPNGVSGNGITNPIIIPSLPYSASGQTTCYADSIGYSSADVFYQFTLEECIDSVAIYTCNSDFDTYLRLLDTSGNQIAFENDDFDNSTGCGTTTSLIATSSLVAGETYIVVVEGYQSNEGMYNLEIETFSTEILGDELSTAIVIPSFPFTTMDSTSNPCLNNTISLGYDGRDIIYQFTTAECHQSLAVNLIKDNGANLRFSVIDTQGAYSYINFTPSNYTMTNLVGNETYYFIIQGNSLAEDGAFSLTLTETEGVGLEGDDSNDPIIINSKNYTSSIINQANCFTNTTGNESNDVFFRFTTNSSCLDSVIISTCEETDFNTLIRLLDENGTQIDIDYNTCGTQSQIIRTDLESNTTYYAVVEGNSGQTGTFTLKYRETVLANNISNGPNGVQGNTISNPFIVESLPFSANGNISDCMFSPSTGNIYVDNFYQFTTNSCPSEYTISTCGLSDFDTYIVLRNANGGFIASNNDECGTSSKITTSTLTPNTTYIVEVEGWSYTDIGNYNLSISSIATVSNPIVYVDLSATGNNDGTTWTDAYTDLQDALANMTDCGNEIWIANGTYYTAAPGAGRSATFNIDKNVVIYGGFLGGETDLASRDVVNNLVELSGDIDDDGTWANNSFHTVKIDNATVTLDGLTIKNGAADQTTFSRARGGGLFVKEANLKLVDCILSNNKAIYGGALFATLSDVEITRSMITANEADNGAALYHSNETAMYINDTRIIANNSIVRCAIEVNNSNYTQIINSIIANNTAANANALAIISTNRDVQCNIYNSTIIGGTKNRALVTLQVGYGDQLDMNVYNSIIAHQNLNFSKNFTAFNNGVLNLNTTNSYIQGASVIGTTTANLYSDTAGDILFTTDGTYALQACSPAVDAGNLLYEISPLDILGNDRSLFNNIDMGAYEETTGSCPSSREVKEEEELVESEFSIAKIYPNPASDMLNIEFNIAKEKELRISVTNLVGQLIMSQTTNSIGGTQTESLDVSRLNAGYYIVNLQDGKNRVSKKFIKM